MIDKQLPDLAADALRLMPTDPRRAHHAALRVRAAARKAGDRGAESAAERVLGLADRESNDLRPAARHLRTAVALADEAGLAKPAARARMSLALVRADQGAIDEAARLGAEAATV